MNKKNIAVIFGGCSAEYGVSLQSAAAVITHMDKSRYIPVPIGINRNGDWYYYCGSCDAIADDTWQDSTCVPAAISPSRSNHGLLVFRGNEIECIKLDAVLPVLHGRNGEDGTVQGLCELAGIPLVGCGTLSSALCMDKHRAHSLVSLAGIRVPNSFVLSPGFDTVQLYSQTEDLSYPLFVKPLRAGSSFGVSKVLSRDKLLHAVGEAFNYDEYVVVEEAIPGFEVGCAVMGNDTLLTGEPDEIELADGFFDFTEKYNLISSRIHVPARISAQKLEEIKEAAKTIYRTLNCKGFARVDMFLTPDGEIVFNEVNTIPGFTTHSRFPGMMKVAGISFSEIITRIIELAVEA